MRSNNLGPVCFACMQSLDSTTESGAALAAKCAVVATAMFASLHQSQAIPEAKPK